MGSNSSKSVPCQAQVQVQRKCETCKTDKEINYKCDQCQVYTCKSCSIIHQHASPSHKIREIGSIQPKLVQQTTESVNQAQFSAKRKCGLCLTSVMTRYICSECETFMCIHCYLIHIQIIHCFNKRNSVSLDQQCACHKKKSVITFCYSCLMEPVCSECILDHINHLLLKPESQHLIVEGRLSKDLEFTNIVIAEIFIQNFENDLIFKYILKEVEQRENSKKTNTANYTKLRGSIEAEQIELKTNLNEIESSIYNFKQILKVMQSRLQTANTGDNTLEVLLKSLNKLPQFYFGKLLQQIENLAPKNTMETARSFGIQVEGRKKPLNMEIDLMMSYETNFTSIETIITLNHKHALIIDIPSISLGELHIIENKITSNDLSLKVLDMSVTPSKEILLNSITDDAIQLINEEGTKAFLSIRPHPEFILSVHMTKNNEIILGVKEKSTFNSLSEDGNERKTKLMIFGTDKKHKQSLEYDMYGQRLFTSPHKITSNVNNEILVIDRVSGFNGRVISLNREGQVRWINQGHPEVNSDYKLFDPTDIVTTKLGQIIVTDRSNHALHVLCEEGDLITCKSVKEQGILCPLSLDIDTSGHLWIGCENDRVTQKAKLHIMNLSFWVWRWD
ncbi:Hypothetical predicted protein [Mytilus galloprovincialis]|uniref:B box-type domain-containing protein n=1 Tax=Mytilus galloprovincialis TaxID=29158 RepID=A0A8B6BZ69_MYTGA|nr:Hypothetical predicted protein [Mytilus galloprovincialis]